ncbi:MAG TPA: hypothetical protein VEP49_03645 [Acidimicrobiia bacterium]|nr:hypothetical protein [Acidimicrobiia bacterium]
MRSIAIALIEYTSRSPAASVHTTMVALPLIWAMSWSALPP